MVFPPFGAASESEVHNFRWPASPESCLQGLQSFFQLSNLSKTKKTKIQNRKLNNQTLLCLRNFWRWSRVKTWRLNYRKEAECMNQRIYHFGTKEKSFILFFEQTLLSFLISCLKVQFRLYKHNRIQSFRRLNNAYDIYSLVVGRIEKSLILSSRIVFMYVTVKFGNVFKF